MSVLDRPRPDFEAAGIHAGGFYLYPRLSLDVTAEDNIFFSDTNEQSDTVFSVRPSIQAVSQWSRHQLRGSAALNTYRYADFSDENNTTYAVEGSGRLDVVRGTALRGSIGYSHDVESRTSASASQFFAEPIEFNTSRASIGGSHEFNRVRVSGDVRVVDYEYEDVQTILGTPLDLAYRDHTNTEEQLRVDYALSPALALFGTVTHNDRSYDKPPLPGDVARDSNGWEGAIGADFDLTAVARGQVQVGYLTQEYDDPRIDESSGLALRSRVEWFPTELTTVTGTAERTVEDTGLIGSAGVVASRATLQVDHELLRNLILTGKVNWSKEEFRGIDRDDTQSGVMLGANYLLSRRVGVFGSYNFLTRNSDGAQKGNDFDANRFQVGLLLQY